MHRLLVWLLLILSELATGAEAAAGDISPRRELVICGPNAVAAMLMAAHLTADQALVEELLPKNPHGMSLSELSLELNARGLRSAVRHCTDADLLLAPKPCVLYLEHTSGGDAHYVLLLSAENGIASLMDATSGIVFTARIEKLHNIWGGYAVVPVADATDPRAWAVTATASCGILALCIKSRKR